MKRYLLCLVLIILAACSDHPGSQDTLLEADTVDMNAKVLVIGFDGATWEMFKPAMDQGKMPRLKNLVEYGVRAPLETIKPTLTPVIWTTIATGKLPEDHGVHAVVDRDPETGEMHPLTSQSVKVKSLWDMATENRRSATIVRWPVTWPVREIDGEMISDFAFQTARPNRVWPKELASLVDTRRVDFRLKDLQALTGVDRAAYSSLEPLWQWKLMVMLREYVLDVQFKDIAKALFERKQRDLMTVYFYSMDALGHNYFKFLGESDTSGSPDFRAMVMNWCWLYDQFLAELLDAVDPNTYVLICSDHGMEIAEEPQNFLIMAEGTVVDPNQPPAEATLPPGPPYDQDPFGVKLQYTAPSGQHVEKPDGIFVLHGAHVRKGWKAPRVHATQIAPTVLYLLNLPVADDFDGTVRLDLFEPEYVASHPVKHIASYDRDDGKKPQIPSAELGAEDDLLLNRLQALGYIQ